MTIFLTILCVVTFSCLLTFVCMYFTDEAFLPYKRKMENMLRTIRSHQYDINEPDVEFEYKGKTFSVGVKSNGDSYKYEYYTVYINGKHVLTWHILNHLYTKSRLEEHHGDMRWSEEYEIIKAAYKYAEQKRKEWIDKYLSKPSYFN